MNEQPILPPSQHESLKAPRSLMAIAIFTLFAATVLLPYWISIPNGSASNIILTTAETVKNIVLIVVGFYFGSTQGSNQKTDAAARSAEATAAMAQIARNATAQKPDDPVTLAPGDSVTVAAEEPEDDPSMYGGPRA